ncbi:MAG: hypothetical protein WAW10_13120 [Gallionella sp.]
MSDKLDLKGCYGRLRDDLRQVDNYIQQITADAYRNVYLISNPVLSRNPFVSSLLHNFLFRIPERDINAFGVFCKLLQYYLKSILYLINHAITWIVVQIFFRPDFRRATDPVIIDNFLLVEPTLASHSYEEKYFPGLHEVLSRRGKDVYIFPCLYGRVALWNKGIGLFSIIRSAPVNIITEYDLLKAVDYFALARFICFYPFAVIRLSRQMDRSDYLGQLLSSELMKTLDRMTVHSYIRYLSGKRLADWFNGKITVISWFENQVQQKHFYRGLKESTQHSSIYACRTYIDYPAYLNSFVAELEMPSRVVPDKILVNGTAYMKHSDNLEYRLGASFRYKYLFSPAVVLSGNETQCLLLFSYFYERNKELLKLCLASVLTSQAVKVRTHPADTRSRQLALPDCWIYDTSAKSSAFSDTAIIITSESGIAVEAAALGVSVIVVASQSSFTCNPMFDCGRGVIWDLVFNSDELNNTYNNLLEQRATNIEGIRQAAEWYKSSCFVEPTEENIVRAFDLA